jgi:hypothetical protein
MSDFIQDFDFSVNLLRHVLWQYDDAARLQALLRQKQDWYDVNQEKFWREWIYNVFDLQTANDFGLSVWGKILCESRDKFMPGSAPDYPAWGFGEYARNYGRGNFRRATAGYQRLHAEQYRLLLQLRYFKFVSRGTVPEINAFMRRLFGGKGNVYVLDPLDMSFAVYVFSYEPGSWLRFVLEDMDALPRPAGVGARIVVMERRTFGFGPYHDNFVGNFDAIRR